ncbi:MAG: fused MFS/spermidine synthase [Pseudomonadota bacterium]
MKTFLFRLHLIIAFILLGLYALSAQVLFIREFLVVFYGNEICLGVIFASWLAGIALGSFVGSRVTDSFRDSLKVFLYVQAAICLLLPIQIYLTRIIRGFFEVSSGEYLPFLNMVHSTLLSILPLSSLIGFSFPLACKIFINKEETAASSIGWVYILESIGSVTAGLVLTFYLIVYFQSFEIITILSVTVLANCLGLSVLSSSKGTRLSLGALCLSLLLIFTFLLVSTNIERINNSSVQSRWRTLNKGIELIESTDSRYQNVSVTYRDGQFSIFGNGQFITDFPDEYRSATFAHLILSEHPHPEEVLLIGGGAGGVIREMLKHPISVLHYVELDPQLISMVRKYLPAEDKEALRDKRVNVFYTDGRYFVKKSQKKYDVIVLNVPDPLTAMLNRFYTSDFFREARRILKKDGVLVTGVSSAPNYIGEEIGDYSGSVYHALLSVFPFVLVTPGDINYFFATSSPNTITSDTHILSSRYADRHIESRHFSRYHFEMLLPPDRVKFIERALREKKNVPVNTDLKPITYFYNLILWDIYSGERGKVRLFKILHQIDLWWFMVPLVVFLLARVIYIVIKRDSLDTHLKFNCLLAIGTTGFAGMSLEIILIFAFQNIYGYIYWMIGLIVAAFMAGLALGGWGMNRMIAREHERWAEVLTVVEACLFVYAFALPYMIGRFCAWGGQNGGVVIPSAYLFISLVGLVGVLTGLEFPLVSKIALGQEKEPGRVAGVINSFDHVGAFLGALLTGTIFVPLLGIKETCFLIGALNMGSTILLLVYVTQSRSSVRSCSTK